MAFNPFHRFRKHQKVIFAVLTIMCMFVFVLQFGQGDFFTRAARWFGTAKGQGPLVATLYGKEYYDSDVRGLRGLLGRRQMTNTLMRFLRYRAVQAVLNDPRSTAAGANPLLGQVLKDLGNSFGNPFTLFSGNDMTMVQSMLDELKHKDGKDDERHYLEQVAAAIEIQMTSVMGGNFFGDVNPGTLLDFEVWKHEADKHGIVLTANATRQEVQRDTAGRNVLPEGSFKSDPQFKDFLSMKENEVFQLYTESQILDALADEYRVVIVQEELFGQSLTYQGAGSPAAEQRQMMVEAMKRGQMNRPHELPKGKMEPVTNTPGAYQQYFNEQRTAATAALLPISIDRFLPDITDQPSETQLRELYDKYKDKDPDPASAAPGFQEPRSVRVQYLQVSPKSEFYQNQAKKFFAPSTAMKQASEVIKREVQAGFSASAAGAGPGSWLTVRSPLFSDSVLQEYNRYCEDLKRGSEPTKRENVAPDIYEPTYDTASALGHILGDLAQGNPLMAPAAITGTSRAHAQVQARGAGAAILAGTSPTPGLVGLLPVTLTYVQPLDKVDAYIVEKTRTDAAKKLLEYNLAHFREELEKLQAKPLDAKSFFERRPGTVVELILKMVKPLDAKTFIERSAKEYDFRLATMSTAKNRQAISDDPALKDLRELFTKRKPTAITKPEEFAVNVMVEAKLYQLEPRPERQFGQSDFNTTTDQTYYYFWLVEDNPPKMRSFADAKPDVIQAWKRMQARKLAIKAARAIEAEAAKRRESWPTDFDNRKVAVVGFLDQYKKGNDKKDDAFVLDKIVRQVEEPTPTPGQSTIYKPYLPPEDRIKYPPLKFTDRVLGLEKIGAATYVEDRPGTTIYVIVLLARKVPTFDEFKHSYEKASRPDQVDSLWREFVVTQREEYRKQVMEKLRTEAAPTDTENGQWKEAISKRTTRGSAQPDDGE